MSTSKIRVYELSKSLDVSNKEILALLEKEFGVVLKSHSSSIDTDVANKLTSKIRQKNESRSVSAQSQSAAPKSQQAAAERTHSVSNAVNQTKASNQSHDKQERPVANGARVTAEKNVVKSGLPPQASIPSPHAGVKHGVKKTVISLGSPSSPSAARPPERPAPERPAQNRTRMNLGELQRVAPTVNPEGSRSALSGAPSTYPRAQRYPMGGQQGNRPPAGTNYPPRRDMPPRQERSGDRPPRPEGGAPRPTYPERRDRGPAPSYGQRPQENRPAPSGSNDFVPVSADPMLTGKESRNRSSGRKAPTIYKPVQAPQRKSRSERLKEKKEKPSRPQPVVLEKPESVDVTKKPITVRELATVFQVPETEVIKALFMKGVMVTINQILDIDAVKEVGAQLEIGVNVIDEDNKGALEVASVYGAEEEAGSSQEKHAEQLISRAPVISIMGHVDHGKTSLLDAIREVRQKVVDTEAGGITQRIGAYSVEKDDKRIVFLDTPGHEAFTAMRMRGAKATDIAILVVAADDGVMPQTIEAINHAKAAGIPIIVAINKIDKDNADPDRVLNELSEHGLIAEKWGGDTITVEVSALQKLGIDDLLEMILLVDELKNFRANPELPAEGVIIEAKLDKGKGPVATALVQNGTLRIGDNVFIGSVGGRVRALIDDQGQRLKEAGPSTPVEILGLSEVPVAGEPFQVVTDDKEFRQKLSVEKTKDRDVRLAQRARATGGLTRSLDDSNRKELRIILKADSHGTMEAVQAAIHQLNTDEVQVNILHSGTGDISEADVMLASASQATILGFNVREDSNAARVSEQEGIAIKLYDVIYHLIETVQRLMLGELDADIHIVETGRAQVRQLFSIGKNVIAGCMITEGKVVREGLITILRDGKELYSGKLSVLKRFKDDVKEVSQGFECGISVDRFNTWVEGDIIVCSIEESRARTSL